MTPSPRPSTREALAARTSLCRAAVLLGALLAVQALAQPAWAFPPERRRDFEDRAANEYLIVPAVASLPGIGVFVGVIGSASNVGDTGIDAAGTVAQSIDNTDIRVRAAALREVPTGWHPLTFDYQYGDIKLGNFQFYLPGRDSPNFTIPITAEFRYQFLRPALRFWERRIEIGYGLAFFDGFDLAENGEESSLGRHSANADLLLDFTDDVVDPQTGMRLHFTTTLPAPDKSPLGTDHGTSQAFGGSEEIRVRSYTANFYWHPSETWVLAWSNQYFEALGGPHDPKQVVTGGSPPLRGYPAGRWTDRYGVFSGVEARYLIPLYRHLDIWLAHGVLETIQLAGFFELGQVSPAGNKTLFEGLHASYGFGIRGLFEAIVIRFDLAFSDEGPQTYLTVGHAF